MKTISKQSTPDQYGSFSDHTLQIYDNLQNLPIPIEVFRDTKETKPHIRWQKKYGRTEIAQHAEKFPNAHCTGLTLGNGLGAIDCDFDHEDISKVALHVFREHLGNDIPVRRCTNSDTRFAILVRLSDNLKKSETKYFGEDLPSTGDPKRDKREIELLANGQYLNIYGLHKLGGHYYWENGHPRVLVKDQFPEVSLELLLIMFNQIHRELKEATGVEIRAKSNLRNSKKDDNVLPFKNCDDDDGFTGSMIGIEIPRSEGELLVQFALQEAGRADAGYHQFRDIMIAWHDYAATISIPKEEALAIFIKYSKTDKWPDESVNIRRAWDSFKTVDKRTDKNGKPITFATILGLRSKYKAQWDDFKVQHEKETSKRRWNHYRDKLDEIKAHDVNPADPIESRAIEEQLDELADEVKDDQHLSSSDRQKLKGYFKIEYQKATGVTHSSNEMRERLYPDRKVEPKNRNVVLVMRSKLEKHTLYVNQHKQPFVDLPGQPSVAVPSVELEDWIRVEALKEMPTQALGPTDLKSIIGYLSAMCRGSGKVHKTFMRYAHDRKFDKNYIDVGDAKRTVLELSSDGVAVVSPDSTPVRFERGASASALPKFDLSLLVDIDELPIYVEEIWRHVNVPQKYRVLFLALVVNAHLAKKEQPIACFVGSAGAGKTTVLTQERDLIDPRPTALSTQARSVDALVKRLGASYHTAFDNLKGVHESHEDILAAAALGSEHEVPTKYETTGTTTFSIGGPMGFTSIATNIFEQGDLNERLVTIRITPSGVEKSKELVLADFEDALPQLWHILLSLDVAVLGLLSRFKSDRRIHRLDEFNRIAQTIQQIVDPDIDLAEVVAENRLQEQVEALQDDLFAGLLLSFISDRYPSGWERPLRDLLVELGAFTMNFRNGQAMEKVIPQEIELLKAKLKSISRALPAHGLEVEFLSRKEEAERGFTRIAGGNRLLILPNENMQKSQLKYRGKYGGFNDDFGADEEGEKSEKSDPSEGSGPATRH